MGVQVLCPGCGKKLSVRDAHLGRKIRCTGCEGTFVAESSSNGSEPSASATAPEKETIGPPAEKPARASATAPEPLAESAPSDNIEQTSPGASPATKINAAPARAGYIGRFEVRARLGAGAFGTVYRAYDPQLDREVALKVPQGGALESAKKVERFLREAKAAARLRHPHIVPVYDAGRDGPRYFIASAFIKGHTLSHAVDEGAIDFRQAAQTVRELAEALAYAHGLGIVHRDVKSSNVMLDEQKQAHLMDFGLAYDTSTPWWSGGAEEQPDLKKGGAAQAAVDLTHDGAVVGTPAYMAPEQAKGKSGDALPASDQYSLGVILYELLCGELPFSGPVKVVLFNVIHQEPPPPRSHRQNVPFELEAICRKAMAKRTVDRYADCQELADDLRRWLEGEPIRALRLGPLQRLVRWCRREPKMAVATALAACSLLAVAVVSLVSAIKLDEKAQSESKARQEAVTLADNLKVEGDRTRQAKEEAENNLRDTKKAQQDREVALRDKEEAAKRESVAAAKETIAAKKAESEATQKLQALDGVRRLSYDARLKLAAQEWDNARLPEARALLQRLKPQPLETNLRGWEWHYLHRLVTQPAFLELKHNGRVNCVAYSPDGTKIASASHDGTVKLWDAETGKEVHYSKESPRKVTALAVAFSNSGLMASAWADGTVRLYEMQGEIKELFAFEAHKGAAVTCLAFHPDPKVRRLVTGSEDKSVKYWDINPDKAVQRPLPMNVHSQPILSVSFSPDAKLLCSAARGGAPDCKLWYFPLWDTWETKGKLLPPQLRKALANGAGWKSGFYEPLPVTSGHNMGVTSMAWHPGSREIALGSLDASVSVLRFQLKPSDTPFGKIEFPSEPQVFFLSAGHNSPVNSVAYYPKGEDRFASASSDRTIRIWDRQLYVPLHSFKGHLDDVLSIAINPAGTRLASASKDGTVKVWDLLGNQEATLIRAPQLPVNAVAYSPDNRYLALGAGWPNRLGSKPDGTADRGEVLLWDQQERKERLFKGHLQGVSGVAFAKDGPRLLLASASHDKTVKVWDVESGAVVANFAHSGPVYAVAFSPDGKRVATAGQEGLVRIWSVANAAQPLHILSGHQRPVFAVAFSPDGRIVASGGQDAQVRFWDTATGKVARPPLAHGDTVYGVTFDKDGKRLASACRDQTATIWNLEPGGSVSSIPLKGHGDWVLGVAFSPDGKRLVTAAADRSARIWDTDTGQEILSLTAMSVAAIGVAFSPDGQRLAVADPGGPHGGAAIVYDAQPGNE